MPQESLTRRLRDLKVSWNSVFQLRNQFAVSTTALLYRILELPKIHGLLWQHGKKGATEGPIDSRYRPRASLGLRFFFPLDESTMNRVIRQNGNFDVPACFGDHTISIPCFAKYMRSSGSPET
jgi:hypothetical protein